MSVRSTYTWKLGGHAFTSDISTPVPFSPWDMVSYRHDYEACTQSGPSSQISWPQRR
jgi:hypothetical protein